MPLGLMLWYWGRSGAGPRYTLELARALKAVDGVTLSLCVSAQSDLAEEFRALAVPTLEIDTYTSVTECLCNSLTLPWLRRRFADFIQSNSVDVVDSTMTHLWSRLVAPVVRKSGAKLLCTVHDASLHPGENGPLKTWFYQPLPNADAYVVLTNAVAGRLADVHGIARARITVVPLGSLAYSASRAPPAPVGGPLRILFIGRILPYKGLDRLVDACTLLRASGRELQLTIAGTGSIAPAVMSKARELGARIENRWIADAEFGEFLQAADVVALPYVEASQSGVIPAAFAAGVTVVATPIGGLMEQVRNGEDGLVTDDTGVPSITRALRALADDRALLARLKAGAGVRARQELAWPPIAARLTDLARALMAKPPATAAAGAP